MQSKQMRKHILHYIISWCLMVSLCCTVPYVPGFTNPPLDFITNDISRVYASELTDFTDSDNNISGTTAAKTNVFEEAQDSAISIQTNGTDELSELEMAIMRKQNTQPVMTAAYTRLDETASKGAIDEEKAAEQKRLLEEAAAMSIKLDTNASFDYSKEASAPLSSHITATGGIYEGPSGKETYYNLPMDGVISIMRQLGYSETDGWVYWVRDDGAKMFGDYVMVAANLDVRPRGSLIECSMGTAIVCDTGDFAKSNANQLDIAVTW